MQTPVSQEGMRLRPKGIIKKLIDPVHLALHPVILHLLFGKFNPLTFIVIIYREELTITIVIIVFCPGSFLSTGILRSSHTSFI